MNNNRRRNTKKKPKFYVVFKGHETGIATTWNKCKSMVDGYSGAKFKGFTKLNEAEKAFYDFV